MQRMIDLTFGLNNQALALAHYLAGLEAEDFGAEYNEKDERYEFRSRTFPWYNGRERGVCLEVRRGYHAFGGSVLYVVWGEVRNGDGIFVDHWTQDHAEFNCPTTETWPEEAYKSRRYTKHGDVATAGSDVKNIVAQFLKGPDVEL